jgi:hypothetical protein
LRLPEIISINHFSKGNRFILPRGASCAASSVEHGKWLYLESNVLTVGQSKEIHPPNCSSCHSKEEADGLHNQPFGDPVHQHATSLPYSSTSQCLSVYNFSCLSFVFFECLCFLEYNSLIQTIVLINIFRSSQNL